jgi:hypothetical protein
VIAVNYDPPVKLYQKRRDREDWWHANATSNADESQLPDELAQGGGALEARADWLALSDLDDDGALPLHDVALAMMLMAGSTPWQRVDGMGMARQALESPLTGNQWRDLTVDERLMLTNGRAWCHAVYGDLSPIGSRNDPVVLADAIRHADLAHSMSPHDPEVAMTMSLIRLRQGRVDDALTIAHAAVEGFGSLTARQRSGRAHGSAVLAVVVLALATASSGDIRTAIALGSAARAMRSAVEVDGSALASLLGELSDLMSQAPGTPPAGPPAQP